MQDLLSELLNLPAGYLTIGARAELECFAKEFSNRAKRSGLSLLESKVLLIGIYCVLKKCFPDKEFHTDRPMMNATERTEFRKMLRNTYGSVLGDAIFSFRDEGDEVDLQESTTMELADMVRSSRTLRSFSRRSEKMRKFLASRGRVLVARFGESTIRVTCLLNDELSSSRGRLLASDFKSVDSIRCLMALNWASFCLSLHMRSAVE